MTGTTGRQLADRVRRARARSVCARCPVLIKPGNLIGHLPGRGWAHIDCIIATQDHPAEQSGAAKEGTT